MGGACTHSFKFRLNFIKRLYSELLKTKNVILHVCELHVCMACEYTVTKTKEESNIKFLYINSIVLFILKRHC